MCGIALHACHSHEHSSHNPAEQAAYLARRGPDHQGSVTLDLGGSLHATLSASVLHLRGATTHAQPVVLPSGSVLCWNGQVYRGHGVEDAPHASDTALLARLVGELEAAHPEDDPAAFGKGLVALFESLEAEFALVLVQPRERRAWFGRDVFGRRSLLVRATATALDVASVYLPGGAEVAADGLYTADLAAGDVAASVQRIPWTMPLTQLNDDLDERHAVDLSLPGCGDVTALPAERDLPAAHLAALDEMHALLSASVRARVLATPPPTGTSDDAGSIALLFSGGIDCSLLAALAHTHLPAAQPIDLVNVAFENPRVQHHGTQAGDTYDVPDRGTARTRIAELRAAFPSRTWRLVEANVPYPETVAWTSRVASLMAPATSEMDLSIARAFWFAARGTPPAARVLLSGLGADEQLGGYARHRAAWEKRGWAGLCGELALDVGRIATRNLGRDDRVVADHGREVRFPFLDTRLVAFLARTPVAVKCDPRRARGVGDKILLRLLARRVGLHGAAAEEKRAIQFGARSAKLTVGSGRVTGTMAAVVATAET
ncbi:hypothetical protein H9P43_009900 [Blastocladiella emersonii ATCC 22665]|nr:hypothetical protein H9P43_009900 [Blastocladiella emersonii ATCC 22665]